MSLLFNMLSRLIIPFLLRNKHLLISWPQLPSAVILEPKKIKSVMVSIVSPSICHEVMGPDAMILGIILMTPICVSPHRLYRLSYHYFTESLQVVCEVNKASNIFQVYQKGTKDSRILLQVSSTALS